MGLYDSYQLANSTRVPMYQGSSVPELVQVSQQLQNRYDTAQNEQDYLGRFMNSLQSLPQDKPAFQDMYNGYKQKLSALSSRPDLENTLRETSMMAANLPQDYAPFAARVQQRQAYATALDKATAAGDIHPDTAAKLLGMSDAQDRGLQRDPVTGQLTGSYTGANYVKDINLTDKVDKWLNGALPSSQGWSHEYNSADGTYTIRKDGKIVDMPQSKIASIINSAAAADSEYQSWIKQQQDLNTYNRNYSHMDPDGLDLSTQMGSISHTDPATGKQTIQPVTARDMLQHAVNQGMSVPDALREIDRASIARQYQDAATNYGVLKKAQHDVIAGDSQLLSSHGMHLLDKASDDQTPSINTSFLQPTTKSGLDNPATLDDAISKAGQATVASKDAYNTWAHNTGLQPYIVDANGNKTPTDNIYDRNARWFDANGNENTSEGRQMIIAHEYNLNKLKQLQQMKQEAEDQANYHPDQMQEKDPELLKKAQDAYNRAYTINYVPGTATKYSEDEKKALAQQAYDRVVASSPVYEKYKQILANNAKGDSQLVSATTFSSKEANQAMEDNFNNLNVNLSTSNGDLGAMQGVQWANGDKANQTLTNDDYKKMIGKARFAGIAPDATGKYMAYYKVGNAKTTDKGKQTGQDVLVKTEADPSAVKEMVSEGKITPAQDILYQNLNSGTGRQPGFSDPTTRSVDLDLGGMRATVRRITPSEKSNLAVAPGVNYQVIYHGTKGNQIKAFSSMQEAINNIINNTSAAKTKP